MPSPCSSTDSQEIIGAPYLIRSFKFKTESGKTRIQILYDDGHKSIIRDISDERFAVKLRSTGGSVVERGSAKKSLEEFSQFMLENNVEVTHGYTCWNLLCAGLDCGIRASQGVLFTPPETMEEHGNVSTHSDEFGFYKVHLTTPILSQEGKIRNRIQLRKDRRYIIAGQSAPPVSAAGSLSMKRVKQCECEQCGPGSETSDVFESVLNPIEVVRDRFRIATAKSIGTWCKGERAVVYMDDSGAAVIGRYAPENNISMFCDNCRHDAGNILCHCDGYLIYSQCGRFRYLGMVAPGPKAKFGFIEEFCPRRFRKLARGAARVLGRLDQLMPGGCDEILSAVARTLRCSVEELVYVLNNDLTLIQPISRGTNCFLRRDARAHLSNRDSLTGKELVRRIFYVDSEGRWIMTGLGTEFGVSSREDGSYHLIEGGPPLQYSGSLANQYFGGKVYFSQVPYALS